MRFLLSLILLLNCFWANADHVTHKDLYWIFFKDKEPLENEFNCANLSEASLLRRKNANIHLNVTDAPLNEAYVAQIEALGVNVRRRSRWLNAVSAHLTPEQKKTIQNLAFVRRLCGVQKLIPLRGEKELNETTVNESEPLVNDYGTSLKQNYMLGLQRLHAVGATGKGVRVAVFDNGFRGVDTLVAFQGLHKNNRILGTFDFVDNDANIYNGGSHGTNVLSILSAEIQGKIIGAAYGASFYLFRTENDDSETPVEEDNWVAAAEWADSAGADIFHTSLGYSTFDNSADDHNYADLDGNTTVITRAADLAAGKGILVVNSAGNEGSKPWRYIIAPADGDSVLAIGAVRSDSVRAAFSSLGPTFDGRIKPDVVAMGQAVTIVRPDGAVEQGSGTSFSGPLISGLGACLKQVAPWSSGSELREAIVHSADRFNNPDNEYGYGLPNAMRAIEYLIQKRLFPLEVAFSNQKIFINTEKTAESLKLLYDLYVDDEFLLTVLDASGRACVQKMFSLSELPLSLITPQFALNGTDAFYYYRVVHKKSGKNILSKKFILFNE